MSLRRFQESFSRNLLAPSVADDDFADFSRSLATTGAVAPDVGFAAYRGNRIGGLVSALGDFFATTKGMLGDDCFSMLAGLYAKHHPAMVNNLNDYGENFPRFLAAEMPEVPFLQDLSAIDWYWHRVFYHRDEPPLSESDLAAAAESDPEEVFFRPAVGLHLFSSDYPLLQIRQYARLTHCERPEAPIVGDGCRLALWRRGYERRLEEIDQLTWNFLSAVQKGLSFQTIADQVFADGNEDAVFAMLGKSVQKGWLVGVSCS